MIKETCAPTIPAENWANKDLIHQDRMNGISEKEFSRNLANGKYRLTETYPEPHRDENGKIIIENSLLYEEDCKKYGAYQAQKWVEQGKYNLNPEELEIVHLQIERKFQHLYSLGCSNKKYAEQYEAKIKEIDAKLATKKWDCRNTEAVRQWQKARAADPRNNV